MTNTVIVGGGLAGLRAAQRLREAGTSELITIVGDEKHRPYNRPPLSKQLLAGTMSAVECEFDTAADDFEWILGNAATALDVENRRLNLTDGEIGYDKLIIATGRGARSLPGLPEMDGFHVLRGLDDAIALHTAAQHAQNVVIVGGGFIGCEVASSLRVNGVQSVTIVERAPTLMPLLGPEIGRFAERLHRDHGVNVYCDTAVTKFDGGSRVERVELDNGQILEADLVLLSLGSVPNTEWLTGSGLELDQGSVVCDEFCHASGHPDIVAVGDVASWTHRGVGKRVRIEHWSNAADMGAAAAENLFAAVGGKTPYSPIPTFWSDQYGISFKAAGFVTMVETFVPVDTGIEGKWNWDGFGESGLVAGFTANDNKAFVKYRRTLAGAGTKS
ncbi:NAD(P)/FAD-dependent oxidoreductase [Rhodococcus pseudokoreensis]|uniref:NAD(P)/FAD-dependent oxidoreductase n=1 Tax=Rhodococcus pseudokoreensis TaxID=2811421 RepID=A0A974ZTP0_9NOCA|nr:MULTISPECIES: FAD/NAD(P)-binding oxidoreductase [Rhodococcus]OUS88661.1 ferredoxin reductase [Rhodococcus sp. NCIMB 12038]QSE89397.1 NAD(P)/FAD-dependent oxidoreductase [Rhodococcus pseudokoreensis]